MRGVKRILGISWNRVVQSATLVSLLMRSYEAVSAMPSSDRHAWTWPTEFRPGSLTPNQLILTRSPSARLSERFEPVTGRCVAGENAMPGSRSPVPQSSGVAALSPRAFGSLLKRWKLVSWALAASVLLEIHAGFSAGSETSRVGIGVSSMSDVQSGSLLVEYFRDFLAKRDVDEFRNRVAARYNEGTLARILAGSPDLSARRAAVLSLGIFGSFEQSNAVAWPAPARRRPCRAEHGRRRALGRMVSRRQPRA